MTGSSDIARNEADAADSASEVFDFLTLFLADRSEGHARELGEYLLRFPGHEAAIEAEFNRLTREESEVAETTELRRSVAHYVILDRLGSGGQGTVLLAEDQRLKRRVALKILAPHLDFVSQDRLQRFRREAEILSHIDHPGICTVYEADTADGVPYLAMRYVEGETLAAIVRARKLTGELPRTRAEFHRTMGWIEAAARALHEAHEAGIVHRDVKPGNIMITPTGEPVLLDFGLARHEHAHDASITRTGQVLGTLAYMAPELLSSTAAVEADRRSDVYALGVSLYESLTHELPFHADSQTALWRAIESGDIVAPRSLNQALPTDLAMVLATALARSPAHRYPTALAFADDLARVRRREPIQAHKLPLRVRLLLWLRRHPTWSIALFAALLLIVVLAVSLRRVLREERVASALNRALNASTGDERAAAALVDLLAACDSSPRADLRSALAQVLDACHLDWWFPRAPLRVPHSDPPPAVDARGERIAIGDSAGGVELRDTRDGKLLARRSAHKAPLKAIAFAGDDLLTAASDGISAWSARDLSPRAVIHAVEPDDTRVPLDCHAIAEDRGSGEVLLGGQGSISFLRRDDWSIAASMVLEPRGAVRHFAFSPDGRHLAVLGKDGGEDADANNLLWLVDTRARRVLHSYRSESQEILSCTFDPSSTVLALAHNGGRVEVFEIDGFRSVFIHEVGQEVNWCGFDPSGNLLLLPNDRGTELWRWRDPGSAPVLRLAHPSERTVGAAAFDSTQHMLASVHRDGTVVIRSTDDWHVLRTFKQRMINVRFLRWLDRTGDLLTADNDNVSAWLVGHRPHTPEYFGHRDAVVAIAVGDDGEHFATASRDGTARVFSLRSDAGSVIADHHGRPVRHVHLTGSRLWSSCDDGVLRVFDSRDGHPLAELAAHEGEIEEIAALPSPERLATIGSDGRCVVWDTAAMRALRQFRVGDAPLRSIAFHPTQTWVALGGADSVVTVWNWATDAVVVRRTALDVSVDWHTNPFFQVRGLAFDRDNHRLLASLVNVRLASFAIDADWAPTYFDEQRFGGAIAVASACDSVMCADFSFGFLTLLHGDESRHVTLDGADPHSNRISAVRVAPDGRTALSASRDGQLLLWDLCDGSVLEAIRTSRPILDACFTRDGRFVITGSNDGTVKLWPCDPVDTARLYLARREAGRGQGR